jgi:hypothetical protein
MPSSGPNSQTEAQHLFRSEAIAAQNKQFGELLQIRPFSLVSCVWFGTAIMAVALGFLAVSHYTEKVRAAGVLFTSQQETPGSDSFPEGPQAIFYMPLIWARSVQPGETVMLRCPECPDATQRFKSVVMQVSPSGLEMPSREISYKITVMLPPDSLHLFQNMNASQPVKLEAEIPLGQKPLVHLLFERNHP